MLCNKFLILLSRCFRKRQPADTEQQQQQQRLQRCLSVLDLTAIGVGSTLGAGIYVVVGQVAKDSAGPAVVVSFLLAAIASILSGLCYAEFGARVPGAGSCYQYALVSAGELPAFLAGWDMILTYMITAAGVAGTLSDYIDSLASGTISAAQKENLQLMQDSVIIRPYADVLAGSLTIFMTVLLSCSLRQVAKANSAFTVVNVTVIAYVIICGLFRLNFGNWTLDPDDAPAGAHAGVGGFAPFGWSGIVRGAGTCFFAFVGFDTIATAGDEAKKPQRDIPLATVLCLICCCICYSGVSLVLTLMQPYYSLTDSAPLMSAFTSVGWPVAAYAIAGGAVCSLCASMFGCIFPMPRVIYAMAKDGLLCRFCGLTAARCQSPAAATAITGCCAAGLATFIRVSTLVDLASIGTLLAYTLVAICVACDRYAPVLQQQQQQQQQQQHPTGAVAAEGRMKHLFRRRSTPSSGTHSAAIGLMMTSLVFIIAIAWLLGQPPKSTFLFIFCLSILSAAALLCPLLMQLLLPQNQRPVAYRVPAVPLLPLLSSACNLALLFGFPAHALLLFSIWMAAGLLLYCTWSCRYSNIGHEDSTHTLLPQLT